MDDEGGFLGYTEVPKGRGVDDLGAGPVSPCVEQQSHIESGPNHRFGEAQLGEGSTSFISFWKANRDSLTAVHSSAASSRTALPSAPHLSLLTRQDLALGEQSHEVLLRSSLCFCTAFFQVLPSFKL